MRKVIVFGVDGLSMPLLQRYVQQGALPHISRMLQQGAATELLPFISAWGDVNFVSLMSGQSPGTAWIGQCMPADNYRTANLLAALEQAGKKAALVHYPETISAAAPHFTFSPYWGRAAPWPGELFKPMGHTTRFAERNGNKQVKQQKLGWPPTATLAYHDKGAWQPLEEENGRYKLSMCNSECTLTLWLDSLNGQPQLTLGEETYLLPLNDWSEWLQLDSQGIAASVRFFVGRFNPQHQDIEILQSQVTRREGLASDATLGQILLENGPWYSKWVARAAPDEAYFNATCQEGGQQSRWLAASALTLTQQHDFSLWATVHRLVDESHHNCLGQCDPQSPFYDAARAEQYEEVMRTCYQILDDTLGELMSSMDSETTLMMISDHGAVPNAYMCDIYRYLEKQGLCKLDSEGRVELAQSEVFLKDERGGLEIFVNLAGREKQGIVSEAQYDAVCAKVLHALGRWHVMEGNTLRNAVSMALTREDAAGMGYWGHCAGDIVFAYNTGFVWGVSRYGEDICPVEVPGANHGPQKPTAQTAMSSNYGALLAFGAGIRQGYYRNRQQLGPYTMVDPAATIAHLLDIDHSQLDGRVMFDLLDNQR
ncbi:hypothetical protein BL250_01840 [Erwinia sp. OLTSP20]|uniref:alkaline phosphatase family protein n=1 Tax=unclassified Erwinia TaxID=2622719 RepID=UPI000C17E2E7|nr:MULTISPECIES: alkaline phosphatase family protein [unclassified Erwinia]PIJ52083.1 hypothetical protein BV501_01485 [Erwinia sp. OAMSP11]PIJ75246.1 hypothetical protein BK416_02405 [Erwinia sp. OLSSP12]PIJ84453.1 hypothetical protein BLD47_02300 [Erwinia sp. OLCASP19]PIJ87067.1 hypothetical protein BLD46_01885 [Erwinia sp. OLMTSP26]PIJ88631.1 hypothetical protein BLD49_01470 [Erwinia sp. OLMDSP33]